MPTSTTIARRALEARISELDQEQSRLDDERQKLQTALSALGSGTASSASAQRRSASGGAKAPKSTKRRRRSKRQPREERVKALLTYAKANPEASNNDIAKELGVTPPYVSNLLSGLRKEKKIDRKGGKLIVS